MYVAVNKVCKREMFYIMYCYNITNDSSFYNIRICSKIYIYIPTHLDINKIIIKSNY